MTAIAWTALGILASTVFGALFYLGARIDALAGRIDGRLDSFSGRMEAGFASLSSRLDAHLEWHTSR